MLGDFCEFLHICCRSGLRQPQSNLGKRRKAFAQERLSAGQLTAEGDFVTAKAAHNLPRFEEAYSALPLMLLQLQ